MTKLTLYGLKNCDTCKKALNALNSSGNQVEFVDIRADVDLALKIPQWIQAVEMEQLLNKRSTTWRNLSEMQQADALAGNAKEVMISNPTLIKRPVIEFEKKIFVGWSKDVQDVFL